MDIGRIKSYLDIHQFLLTQQIKNNYLGKNLTNRGYLENTVVGDNVSIGKNTNIKNSIILDSAIIEDNTTITNSIIGENSMISTKCQLSYVIIGDNELIDSMTNLENTSIWTQKVPEEYPKKQIGNVIGE